MQSDMKTECMTSRHQYEGKKSNQTTKNKSRIRVSPEVHLTIPVSQGSNSVMDFQTHNTHVFAELHSSNYTRYVAINGIRHEERKIKRSRSGRNLYEIPSWQFFESHYHL